MKITRAAGFVTFYEEDNELKVVLLDHGKHISHPKGHLEENETKLQAAQRELLEETNLTIKECSDSPVYTNKYNINRRKRKKLKKVYLYAGIANHDDISISKEHKRYYLLVPSRARDTLTYKGDQKALDAALQWYRSYRKD